MRRLPITIAVLATFLSIATNSAATNSALGQNETAIEPPLFRPRTDPMATRDADAVRERLKALSDSRGPINPLGDYVKPKEPAKLKRSDSDRNEQVDDEARRVPSLNAEAQQRLKAQPPSIAPSERFVIGLYPPPQIVTNAGAVVPSAWQDDGFRPLNATTLGSVPSGGIVVSSNYQVGDPAAMIPPSLGIPSGSIPTYSAPPSSGLPPVGVPSINPPMNPPYFGGPSSAVPMSGAPATTAPPIGGPAMIAPPGGSLGAMTGGVPIVGAPGSNVIPAPPSYIVPSPAGTYAPAGSYQPAGTYPPAGGYPTASNPAPYATPTPTYSRSGGTVNSLPFVSPPPQSRDTRWMVSPDVYRRMEGGVCTTPTGPGYGAPSANAGTGSPFFYAPPTAMPMPTPRTASRHSWLHPFRH